MTAAAWRQLRRHWHLRLTPGLLWQSYVAGPLFSVLGSAQASLTAEQRRTTSLAGSLFVLGYWRSGTTLLHDYLCRDSRFGFPSTYACMQPHHFVLTRSAANAQSSRAVRRPMDDVAISAASPQEDEFALLALGARSPYEALMVPRHLDAALALSDPRELSARELQKWRETFVEFLSGVSVVEGRRPLILKSPPHGYRVAMLRELIPDARFVLIVRSPEIVFESAVQMWRALFSIYSMDGVSAEDDTRRAVLQDRPRFEAKLAEGLCGLAPERLAIVRYEDLVREPLAVLGRLYEQLRLGGFSDVEPLIREQVRRRGSYCARNAKPPERWARQLRVAWQPIFAQYGYPLEPGPGR